MSSNLIYMEVQICDFLSFLPLDDNSQGAKNSVDIQ